jgi:hypothetical protein
MNKGGRFELSFHGWQKVNSTHSRQGQAGTEPGKRVGSAKDRIKKAVPARRATQIADVPSIILIGAMSMILITLTPSAPPRRRPGLRAMAPMPAHCWNVATRKPLPLPRDSGEP